MSKLTIKELLNDIENVQSAYELAERVEKVLALHKPRPIEEHVDAYLICCTCVIDELDQPDEWPCPTIRALEGEP